MFKRRIVLLGVFISLFCLSSCANRNTVSPDLPAAGQIERVEFEKNVNGILTGVVEYRGSYAELLSDLTKVRNIFVRESINDQPSGMDEYTVVRLYSSENSDAPDIVYAYVDRLGRAWIEQPYIGIWRVPNEIYDRIVTGCDEGKVSSRDCA